MPEQEVGERNDREERKDASDGDKRERGAPKLLRNRKRLIGGHGDDKHAEKQSHEDPDAQDGDKVFSVEREGDGQRGAAERRQDHRAAHAGSLDDPPAEGPGERRRRVKHAYGQPCV